jgi:hypothetical protein
MSRCCTQVPLGNWAGQNSMKEEYVTFCVISDSLEHTATAVHSFISCIVHRLVSDVFPHLKKVYYFNDGVHSQYKNCKILKLCCHEDFHVAAEWNLHGQSPYSGFCWIIKQLVLHAGLQTTEKNILTPEVLYKWAEENIRIITFLYITWIELKLHVPRLTDRLQFAETVHGA